MTSHRTQIRSFFTSLTIDLVACKTHVTVHELSALHHRGDRLRRQRRHAMAVVASGLHILSAQQRLCGNRALAVRLERGHGPAFASVARNATEALRGMTFQNRRVRTQRFREISKQRVVIGKMASDTALDGGFTIQLNLPYFHA
jgi:hypothetical protein